MIANIPGNPLNTIPNSARVGIWFNFGMRKHLFLYFLDSKRQSNPY